MPAAPSLFARNLLRFVGPNLIHFDTKKSRTVRMADRTTFTTRLPPHVNSELERLFENSDRHFKKHFSKNDMLGALIIRARRHSFGLMDDLSVYLDVEEAWDKHGKDDLPDL